MTKEERTDQLKMRGLFAFAAVIMAVLVILKILEPEDTYECCDSDNRIIIVQRSEIEIKEDEEPIHEVDPAERELLAHVIYGEAGGCSTQAQYYVGSVVLNRINDSYYPDTMTEVVYQTEPTIQYGCTYDGNIDKEPSSETYEIADKLLRYGSVVPKDVIFQSEYTQGSGIWKEIDGIYFCYK